MRLNTELAGVLVHSVLGYLQRETGSENNELAGIKNTGKNTAGSLFRLWYANFSKYIVPDTQRIFWVNNAIKAATKLISQYQIPYVLTTSPPHSTQLVGGALKRKFREKIQWIADYRDMWSLSHIFDLNYARRKSAHEVLEKSLLMLADKNIFVSDGILKKTAAHFKIDSLLRKSRVITNGFDREDFTAFNPSELVQKNKINFSYVGTLLGPQAHNKLAEAIIGFTLKDAAGSTHFNFAGEFNPDLIAKLKELNSVSIYPKLKHATVLDLMNGSDFLILILTNDNEGKVAFSGKFFEYLKIGKPILALVPEGEVSFIIRKYNLGIICDPDNETEIMGAISEIMTGKFNLPGEVLLKQFDREELCYQLESFILN